jgi:hypothetical protein
MPASRPRPTVACAVTASLLAACGPAAGLRATPAGTGPMVRVDWDAKPLPDLPFPNDLATRPDETSPTGLRVNISTVADTEEQSETREKLDTLTGWGVFQPITVGFDQLVDLDDVWARHAGDRRPGADRLDDDAIFLVNVTPGSPDYLAPARIDIGEGSFPMDVWDPTRFFPNDTRVAEPSVVFDTIDEDLDGDAELDWGEDTDNDGILDIKNVLPEGGDSWEDLLSWYERNTNTFVIRPTVPLLEKTTYAVVVTERLVGMDGQPARSPWPWVNHTRQTSALVPLEDALPPLGLSVDDVAFAWTFTTGAVTDELIAIRRGLYGEGPLAWLESDFPANVHTAQLLHSLPGQDPYNLPLPPLINALELIGEIEDGGIETENYMAFGDRVVGGSVDVPFFLVDKDDEGRDTSEEIFELDLQARTAIVEAQRVPFTCVLPKAVTKQPPYDVLFYGHGYRSSRFEIAAFAWALNRLGFAVCSFDFPGHGLSMGPDDRELADAVLGGLGLLEFLEHLDDSRARDLDNNGTKDSGGDQWSADAFHTRDQVRQAAVDWMQLVRAFRRCGTGEMALQYSDERRVACDWDGNGLADIGGPDARYYIAGGSLGGINSSVAAGVMPEVRAWVPVVSGGGLLDIALRSVVGGAVEAMAGRLMTPIFYGREDAGGLEVFQMVNSVTRMIELPVGRLPSIPAGGRVVVENLDRDLVREGYIPVDGTFRVGIATDGLRPSDKAWVTGMPATGPVEGVVYEVPDNAGLGDRLKLTFYDASGAEFATIDTWAGDVVHEGVTMRAGSPLIAASYGSGYIRASSEVRRVAMVFGAILEPGDPIGYSPLYTLRPPPELGGRPANVLHMPFAGDPVVSINTGISQGRAMGVVGVDAVDPRYGVSQAQWLVDRQVVRGIEERGPFTCDGGVPCLFDADDLDDGTSHFGEPSDAPLRATVETNRGVVAMRIPYPSPQGGHGPDGVHPEWPFDPAGYMVGTIGSFFHFDGQFVPDDPCLQDLSCDWYPPLPEAP